MVLDNTISRRTFMRWCIAAGLMYHLNACSKGESGAGWVFSPYNPVLGKGLGVCFDPCVIKEGSLYRMWFSWRTQHSVAYTESRNGYEWSEPKIVLSPDPKLPSQTEVNRPTVLVRNGVYHLWYTGQSVERSEIYYATSSDGLTWNRASSDPVLIPAAAYEKQAVMTPNVLWDEEAACFRMYYSAGEQYEPDCICLATSRDGKVWTRREQPVFLPDESHPWEKAKVTAPDVHRVDGWYYMFYIGFADVHHAAIGIARSRDGISQWERHRANPILQAPGMLNPFAWDRDAIYKPAAVLDAQGWALFFNARRHDIEQIGMATHQGRDLGF